MVLDDDPDDFFKSADVLHFRPPKSSRPAAFFCDFFGATADNFAGAVDDSAGAVNLTGAALSLLRIPDVLGLALTVADSSMFL